MSTRDVMTSRGKVVAIGELSIIKSEEFSHEIPRLSFVIVSYGKNSFVSTCIDLHIDGDGTSMDEAKENMGNNVYEFLCVNFRKNRDKNLAWDHLKSLVMIDENSKELWDAFTMFKFELARKGIKTDKSTELYEFLSKLKEKINTFKHDKYKEISNTQMQKWISEQNKEIARLHEENMKLKGTLMYIMMMSLYSKQGRTKFDNS
jgi:hypothetical protein